jgi:hypothetical protein
MLIMKFLLVFLIISMSYANECNDKIRKSLKGLSISQFQNIPPGRMLSRVQEIHDVLYRNVKFTKGSRISGMRVVPTSSTLYPYGWGWDTAFAAMGAAHRDPELAVKIMQYYIKGSQWGKESPYHDGMIPHIFFNGGWKDADYFPGPGMYGTTKNGLESSTMDQPAVWGIAMEDIWKRGKKTPQFVTDMTDLTKRIDKYHNYILEKLDPLNIDLPVIHGPWQSGRDNAKAWHLPLSRLKAKRPTLSEVSRWRRDLKKPEDVHHRPSDEFYQKVIYLIMRAKENNFRPAFEEFSVVDPMYVSIFIWADESLSQVAKELGLTDISNEALKRAQRTRKALKKYLWNENKGRFDYLDVAEVLNTYGPKPIKGKNDIRIGLYDPNDIGSYAPVMLKNMPGNKLRLIQNLKREYIKPFGDKFMGLPSLSPLDDVYEPQRYWVGPMWSNYNYLMLVGQGRYDKANSNSLKKYIQPSFFPLFKNGPAEHYNPELEGTAEGAINFTWDASLAPYYYEALTGKAFPTNVD